MYQPFQSFIHSLIKQVFIIAHIVPGSSLEFWDRFSTPENTLSNRKGNIIGK